MALPQKYSNPVGELKILENIKWITNQLKKSSQGDLLACSDLWVRAGEVVK